MPYRLSIACLVALATLVPAAATQAYYVEARGVPSSPGTEVPIRYADSDELTADTIDVTYRLNETTFPAGAGVAGAVRSAFDTWTAAACSNLVLNEGAASTSTNRAHWMDDAGEIYILVYFTDTAEEWPSAAVGHFYFVTNGSPEGTIVGGTVVLNSRDFTWATDEAGDSMDVQSVVTAIIGRSLGITSGIEGNATFPRYAAGDISKRDLGDDDLAAIAFLYPSAEPTCDAITPPEMECDGVTSPGEEPCPPLPMTMPPDGGIPPPRDGGVMMTDSGTAPSDAGADAGVGGMGDGCTCRVGARSAGAGGSSPRGVAWLGALVFAFLVTRRRRR